MTQRIREWLVLTLIAALPFHALLITVLSKIILGSDHAPLAALALWKEALLGVVILLALGQMIDHCSMNMKYRRWKVDVVDFCIIALLVIALSQYSIFHIPYSSFLYGFKYDLLPLLIFLVLRRVPWSDAFRERALRVIMIVGGIVAAYGILSFFLPQEFFVWLGYSDLHSLYRPDAPLAAFQHIGGGGIRRIQSTLSGPNQLGMWLLLPLSAYGITLLRGKVPRSKVQVLSFLLIGVAMLLTLSRAAWIAAAVIFFLALWMHLPRKVFYRVAASGAAVLCVFFLLSILFFPNILLRAASTRDHLVRPLEAIRMIIDQPLGYGLGSAGPASNRTSDACVTLEEGSDARWAADRPNLCVFVAEKQVQPIGRECHCPVLPENWYLQVGVELGVIGMVVFFLLIISIIRSLDNSITRNDILGQGVFLAFVGVSIGALFLHAWEDSAVAVTVWMMAGTLHLWKPPSIPGPSSSSISAANMPI